MLEHQPADFLERASIPDAIRVNWIAAHRPAHRVAQIRLVQVPRRVMPPSIRKKQASGINGPV